MGYVTASGGSLYRLSSAVTPSGFPLSIKALRKSYLRCGNDNFRVSTCLSSFDPIMREKKRRSRSGQNGVVTVTATAGNAAGPSWESWKPEKTASSPSLSDVIWPAAGAFAAMAILGKIDQIMGPKKISISIAPLGAVSAILFTTPSSPAARKYNMFVAQIGCAAIGVIAFSILGPCWFARSTALAASIAFMIYARASHPPAASMPLMFIDGAKFHNLNFWYAFFPGTAACAILCLIQEVVSYLKDNFRF